MIVTAKDLAAELNISQQRIRQFVQAGMPRHAHGKYDLETCLQWVADNRQDQGVPNTGALAEERTRYYKAQADTVVFNLEVKRGEHVQRDVVLATLSNIVHGIIGRLDTWVDQAPSAEEMNLRRECSWSCRDEIGRAVESAESDLPGVSEHQSAGLRNRRQLR